MLVKGNKIEMVKALPHFNMVGDVFEVVHVGLDGSITIKSSYGIGVMSYKEFEEYFKIVKEYEWVKLNEYIINPDMDLVKSLCDLSIGKIGDMDIKTDNEKFVMLKFGEYVTEAKLHPEDEFDLIKGIKICICRLNKIINKKILNKLIL